MENIRHHLSPHSPKKGSLSSRPFFTPSFSLHSIHFAIQTHPIHSPPRSFLIHTHSFSLYLPLLSLTHPHSLFLLSLSLSPSPSHLLSLSFSTAYCYLRLIALPSLAATR